MGYTTDFSGEFTITPTLSPELRNYLAKFSRTRRMGRHHHMLPLAGEGGMYSPCNSNGSPWWGVEGEYYIYGGGDFGQGEEPNVIDHNVSPRTQPSLWCDWVPNEDGTHLQWNGSEKFYAYVKWLKYLITNFFAPLGYSLNGEVQWRGEEWEDTGFIIVKNNVVSMTR